MIKHKCHKCGKIFYCLGDKDNCAIAEGNLLPDNHNDIFVYHDIYKRECRCANCTMFSNLIISCPKAFSVKELVALLL